MEKRLFLILLILVFLCSFSSAYQDSHFIPQENGTFVLKINSTNDQGSLINSLNSLRDSKELDYKISGDNIIVDLKNAKNIREIEITNNVFLLRKKVTGYIVELKEPSLLEKKGQIEAEQKDQGNYGVQSAKDQETTLLNEQKANLKDEHDKAINDISQKESLIGSVILSLRTITGRIIFAITGYAISVESPQPVEIKKEFYNSFNGFAINSLPVDQIEKIKESPYVKGVFVDEEVKADLYDSVPLIGANKVWGLKDSQGNNITGKGVTIAIIDTGVNYTHPDLGGCIGVNCKVIGGYDIVNNDNDPMDDMGHGTHVAATAAGNGSGASVLNYKSDDFIINSGQTSSSGGGGGGGNSINSITANGGGSGNTVTIQTNIEDGLIDADLLSINGTDIIGPSSIATSDNNVLEIFGGQSFFLSTTNRGLA